MGANTYHKAGRARRAGAANGPWMASGAARAGAANGRAGRASRAGAANGAPRRVLLVGWWAGGG